MALTVRQALQTGLQQLESERRRVDRQIALIGSILDGTRGGTVRRRARRKRRPLTAAARRAISRRMKAYWAKRRRASRS